MCMFSKEHVARGKALLALECEEWFCASFKVTGGAQASQPHPIQQFTTPICPQSELQSRPSDKRPRCAPSTEAIVTRANKPNAVDFHCSSFQ